MQDFSPSTTISSFFSFADLLAIQKLNNSWNTTQEIIRITPEYIADEEQKRKERKLKSRIDNIRRTRENILENRKYPKKLLTEKFKRQIRFRKSNSRTGVYKSK